MPRKARIDATGALHHVIARGIEKRLIFRDDVDRNDFLNRLAAIIDDTATRCLAWALLPNHFHLLLKTGRVPIATVMRRLLTGYAVTFNYRHRRSGHLFQNRYKSILCQEDAYLTELVRYIHLNPVRAGIVNDLLRLDSYEFCGHSTLVGNYSRPWQDTDAVLGFFAERYPVATKAYRTFVGKGIHQGKREDLIGGGLIRSAGGWSNLMAMRKEKSFHKSDERILGDSDFVENVLREAREQKERKTMLNTRGVNLDRLASIVAELMNIEAPVVFAPGKERTRVAARSLLCFWAVRELGLPLTELSRKLGISPSAISLSVQRGERLAEQNGYSLATILNL